VMEPFVAYAAPRVEPATRAEYLRSWQAYLLATAGDAQWQARLGALADIAARNRMPVDDRAWAAQR
jgi:NAD(P)H dehydrogenase (quinone)